MPRQMASAFCSRFRSSFASAKWPSSASGKAWRTTRPGTLPKALKEWRPLAEGGNAKAEPVRGNIYGRGEGISRDSGRGDDAVIPTKVHYEETMSVRPVSRNDRSTKAAGRQGLNTISLRALGWFIAIPCVLLLDIPPALGDVPVVFVFLVRPFQAWWATILGVLFEGFCVWRFLGLSWVRTVTGVIVANIVSTVLGVIPIWFFGLAIELALRRAMAGTDPMTQVLAGFGIAQLLLPVINTAIELPVLILFGAPRKWRSAKIIYAANFVSVALLIWPLFLV